MSENSHLLAVTTALERVAAQLQEKSAEAYDRYLDARERGRRGEMDYEHGRANSFREAAEHLRERAEALDRVGGPSVEQALSLRVVDGGRA